MSIRVMIGDVLQQLALLPDESIDCVVTSPPYWGLRDYGIKAGCPVGGVVLDPFSGAGTTAMVADRLGRDAILIELNPAYVDMSIKRITNDAPLFVRFVTPAPNHGGDSNAGNPKPRKKRNAK